MGFVSLFRPHSSEVSDFAAGNGFVGESMSFGEFDLLESQLCFQSCEDWFRFVECLF